MSDTPDNTGTVYLLHFEPPYKHAKHYMGWTTDVEVRVERHRNGGGSPLVKAALAAGCVVTVVRTWPNVTRAFERELKNRKGAPRLCPTCRGEEVSATDPDE